jgi:hypothetical protein
MAMDHLTCPWVLSPWRYREHPHPAVDWRHGVGGILVSSMGEWWWVGKGVSRMKGVPLVILGLLSSALGPFVVVALSWALCPSALSLEIIAHPPHCAVYPAVAVHARGGACRFRQWEGGGGLAWGC